MRNYIEIKKYNELQVNLIDCYLEKNNLEKNNENIKKWINYFWEKYCEIFTKWIDDKTILEQELYR